MGNSYTDIVISDLDGCLLDHDTYDPGPARAVVEQLRERGAPLVLCSSKTRAEIEHLRRLWGLNDPFVSENGGGLYWPRAELGSYPYSRRTDDDLEVMPLGCHYPALRWVLVRTRQRYKGPVVGFGDLSAREVSAETGLDMEAARRALAREFDEPFRVPAAEEEALIADLRGQGYSCQRGGRYWHLTAGHDKGKAVRQLARMYFARRGRIRTIGLGDSLNDLGMLAEVDLPVIVRSVRPEDTEALRRALPRARVTEQVGPAGWAQAVTELAMVRS